MKKMILALAMVMSSQVFAGNCFERVTNDLGLNLSKVICVNAIELKSLHSGTATFTLDGKTVKKNIFLERTQAGLYKVEDIQAIYTSERPECSAAFEGHVDMYLNVSQTEISINKLQGRFVESHNYCEQEGEVTGIISFKRL